MTRVISTMTIAGLIAVAGTLAAAGTSDETRRPGTQMETTQCGLLSDRTVKPLTESVNLGLEWLANQQLDNGGWGPGDHAGMGRRPIGLRTEPVEPAEPIAAQVNRGAPTERADVANTCMSATAFVRAGSSATDGTYAPTVRVAIEFVCGQIEAADDNSLWITDTRGTRVQSKIGTYIDTFAAAAFLAEIDGETGDEELDARVTRALGTVVAKIEKHQKADGTFDGAGWAPVLGQGLAVKGLNRAAQAGVKVSQEVLDRAQTFAEGQFDADSGSFAGDRAAGVEIYSASASLGSQREYATTQAQRAEEARKDAEESGRPEDAVRAKELKKQWDDAIAACTATQTSVVDRIADKEFVAGFGSNGGEEFLSYLNISESLVVDAPEDFDRWDNAMVRNLGKVQNEDGSWAGHHCITGRTFCTSTALLVLLADRTPVPPEAISVADPATEIIVEAPVDETEPG